MTRTCRSASSGRISGSGLAIAKTMGSRPMRLRSRADRIPGTERPMKTSAPSSAALVDADDVTDTQGLENLDGGRPGGADPRHDHTNLPRVLPHDLERVE